MPPVLASPLVLAALLLAGVPWAQRARLPRDVALAAGVALGAGLLAATGFLLHVFHVPTPSWAAGALVAIVALGRLAGGRPRLPRRRALVVALGLFALATLGVVLVQPLPQGAGWANDWALHYEIDRHYADPLGMRNVELEFHWSALSRPALFNLARLPAEVLLGGSYAAAEAAACALAVVLPAGAWLFLREVAPLPRARRALALLPATAYWVHMGAYPKPIALATGLALAALGLVLRARRRARRGREERGLLPLAAALGALAGVAHPVAGLGLLPVAVAALSGLRRERLKAALLAVAIALPWPAWAAVTARSLGGSLAEHDPIRRHGGRLPLSRGMKSVGNLAWNATMSVLPGPLLGHGAALAEGKAAPSRQGALDVLLQTELNPLLGAVGFATLVVALRRRPRPPVGRSVAVAAAVAGGVLLAGFWRLLQPDALVPAFIEYNGSVVDKRPGVFAIGLAGVALLAVAWRLRSARGEHLAVATALFQGTLGLLLVETREFQGIAHVACAPAVAIVALWLAAEASTRWTAVEGLIVLLALTLGARLGWLPDEGQGLMKTRHEIVSVSESVGVLSWVGVGLLIAVAVSSFTAVAREREGRSLVTSH